jgi:hypothetical protein
MLQLDVSAPLNRALPNEHVARGQVSRLVLSQELGPFVLIQLNAFEEHKCC